MSLPLRSTAKPQPRTLDKRPGQAALLPGSTGNMRRAWLGRGLPNMQLVRHWLGQLLMVGALALAITSLAWLLLPAVRSHDGQAHRVAKQVAPVAASPASAAQPAAQPAADHTPDHGTGNKPIGPVEQQLAADAGPPAVGRDAALRLQLGNELAEQGRDAQAIDCFARLAADYPQLVEAHNNLAVMYVRTGQMALARQTFERALRTSAHHAMAYDNLRQLYAQLAAQAYAQALQQPAPAIDPHKRYAMIGDITPPPGSTGNVSPKVAPDVAPGGDSQRFERGFLLSAANAADVPPRTSAADSQPVEAVRPPAVRAAWWSFGSRAEPLPGPVGAVPASGSAAGSVLSPNIGRIASVSLLVAMLVVLAMAALQTRAATGRAESKDDSGNSAPVTMLPQSPEARLIEIYRLIGAAESHDALAHAESLVNDSPNFQLAQLVYGDLLLSQGASLDGFGTGSATLGPSASAPLSQLQHEAVKRLQALRASPPTGTVPSAFVQLASTTRHAIAVDATHSRLYLLENRASGLVLVSSHYIATGRQGVGKRREGDLRTPLGVYFISGRLDARDLDDFYGVGALPLNYPNEHDRRHGRTGADIWLHGTPPSQFSRPPDSTNGCIVLANDDLRRLWRELAPQHTPVVIARHLDWVAPQALATQRRELLGVLESWRLARSHADVPRALSYHSASYRLRDVTPAESRRAIEHELTSGGPRERELREVSVLSWQDEGDRAVVTFTEYIKGARQGVTHRQYWNHEQGHWKLYSEGVIE